MHDLVKLCKLQMKELRTMSNIHHKLKGQRKICVPREHSNSKRFVVSWWPNIQPLSDRYTMASYFINKDRKRQASSPSPML